MLHSESLGSGPNLIFLHGLFGAGDNWRNIARQLSEEFTCHLLDLPNHGRSYWTDDPSMSTVAQAVADWCSKKQIDQCYLLGHSMGGKVAMQMALNDWAERIPKLIVVDIAPKTYPPHHQDIFQALRQVNFSTLTSRQAVGESMQDLVTDDGIRQFLLKSLYKQGDSFAWRFNVQVLEQRYEEIAAAPQVTTAFRPPTLFIKGMNSQYITQDDQQIIQTLFPNARAKLIEGAGHWPHAEKPAAFTKIVRDFLTND